MATPGSPAPVDDLSRREFLGHSAKNAVGVATGAVVLSPRGSIRSPNERVSIGVVGVRQRGRQLASSLASRSDVDVPVLCDVDESVSAAAGRDVSEAQGWRPDLESDFRRLLDRPGLDAVVIAVPDHWHAQMTRLACEAEKDVYVEAPVSRTIAEACEMIETVNQTGRVVQSGLQQRSGFHYQSAIDFIHDGGLGRVRMARAWTVHRGKPIGIQSDAALPSHVDYQQWLGPAPSRPFNPNRFHQNWRWFWDYGSGALGHWGVHMLDVARWGLGLDLPERISATGGSYHFHDDRESPDTLCVQFQYPSATLLWEHRLWSTRGPEGRSTGTAFYGELGTLVVDRGGWKVYDRREAPGGDGGPLDAEHLGNFVDCLRSRQSPVADIRVGATSSVLCHLGNLAFRLGRELVFDPVHWNFGEDTEANHCRNGVIDSTG